MTCRGRSADLQPNAGQDRELGGGVLAVDVVGGIGFRKTRLLSLGERVLK